MELLNNCKGDESFRTDRGLVVGVDNLRGVLLLKVVSFSVGKTRIAGIEPTRAVLKTAVLPLNYTPLFKIIFRKLLG